MGQAISHRLGVPRNLRVGSENPPRRRSAGRPSMLQAMSLSEEIIAAVAALKRGELVAMPTETVYGLAADARNSQAIARIFATKNRPPDHPLIVHLADARELDQWAIDIPAAARVLADQFWPGPLTLILRRSPAVPDSITGGQDSIGLRVPAHPIAHELISRFGSALAAPSANRFGRISPTTAAHVRAEFGNAVKYVLDGGASILGLESTIIDMTCALPRMLRPGSIKQSQIEAWIGPLAKPGDGRVLRASGGLAAHYAPGKPLLLVRPEDIKSLQASAHNLVWLAHGSLPGDAPGIALSSDAENYGRELYAALRLLDAHPAGAIAVVIPPPGEAWTAIHDRLNRAAAGSGAQIEDDPELGRPE